MTKDEALKLALDWFCCYLDKSMSRNNQETLAEEAITAIKEALAQPEQEPVAWTLLLVGEHHGIIGKAGDAFASAPEHYRRVDVYTTPPQRTWVGLTEKDILEAAVKSQEGISPRNDTLRFAVAIEAKLKEKNT